MQARQQQAEDDAADGPVSEVRTAQLRQKLLDSWQGKKQWETKRQLERIDRGEDASRMLDGFALHVQNLARVEIDLARSMGARV